MFIIWLVLSFSIWQTLKRKLRSNQDYGLIWRISTFCIDPWNPTITIQYSSIGPGCTYTHTHYKEGTLENLSCAYTGILLMISNVPSLSPSQTLPLNLRRFKFAPQLWRILYDYETYVQPHTLCAFTTYSNTQHERKQGSLLWPCCAQMS